MPRKKSEIESDLSNNMADMFAKTLRYNKRKFKFTPKQRKLLSLLTDDTTRVIFIAGPAGTSKTFMSIYGMLEILKKDYEYDILYVRSLAESASRGIGSLPGNVDDKFGPFLTPLYDKIEEIVAPSDALDLKKSGKISAMPINFLRGANWNKKLVYFDEAQNADLKELTTAITRISKESKLIIGGDFMQSDIYGKSGFREMFDRFDDEESKEKGIHTFKFDENDIVRDELLKFIIKRLSKV